MDAYTLYDFRPRLIKIKMNAKNVIGMSLDPKTSCIEANINAFHSFPVRNFQEGKKEIQMFAIHLLCCRCLKKMPFLFVLMINCKCNEVYTPIHIKADCCISIWKMGHNEEEGNQHFQIYYRPHSFH